MRRRSCRHFGGLMVVAVVLFGVGSMASAAQEPTPDSPVTNPAVAGGPPTTAPSGDVQVPDSVAPTVGESETIETKGAIDDPAQKRLRWVIGGLVGLAVVIMVATVWFWRATSPKRRAAEAEGPAQPEAPIPSAGPGGGGPATVSGNGSPAPRPDPLEGVRVARIRGPLPPGHRAPVWADEHVAVRSGRFGPSGSPEAER